MGTEIFKESRETKSTLFFHRKTPTHQEEVAPGFENVEDYCNFSKYTLPAVRRIVPNRDRSKAEFDSKDPSETWMSRAKSSIGFNKNLLQQIDKEVKYKISHTNDKRHKELLKKAFGKSSQRGDPLWKTFDFRGEFSKFYSSLKGSSKLIPSAWKSGRMILDLQPRKKPIRLGTQTQGTFVHSRSPSLLSHSLRLQKVRQLNL